MKTRPITETCLKALQTKTHVCFGVSPFNSYFSDQRIQELALWGKNEFEAMHFFVPDVPSAYTLEALGYTTEKAAWKARRQAQYLHNKIHKVLVSIGYSQIEAEDMFLGWEKLSDNTHYLNLSHNVKKHFEQDSDFRKACLEASKWVLEKRIPDTESLTPDTLESAARYLLAEIPLFLDSAGIVGKKSSIFCYHQIVPFLENLFHNRYPVTVATTQGFALIQPIIQNESSVAGNVRQQESLSEIESTA